GPPSALADAGAPRLGVPGWWTLALLGTWTRLERSAGSTTRVSSSGKAYEAPAQGHCLPGWPEMAVHHSGVRARRPGRPRRTSWKNPSKGALDVQIVGFPAGMFQTNCYIVSDDAGDCVIVDPGQDAEEQVRRQVSEAGRKPGAVS